MSQDKKTPPPEPDDDDNIILVNPAEHVLGGGIRGEVAGCPTGCSRPTARPRRPEEEKKDNTPGTERGKE
jgi:hypothetical protein